MIVTVRTRYFLVLFLFLSCFLCLRPITAGAALSISPTILEMRAYPGGLQTFTLSVGNNGQETLTCTMSVTGMTVAGQGLPVASDTAPRSCAGWMTFQPQEFQLKPGAGKRVVCRLRPPKGVSGGYYGLVACLGVPREAEPGDDGSAGGSGASIRFRHQIKAVVMLTIPGSNVRPIVEPAEPFIKMDEQTGGYRINVPVRNRGTVHDRISGKVEVRSEAGQVIESFDLVSGKGFLLPDQERVFSSIGKITLPDGIYAAHIRLDRQRGGPMKTIFPFVVREGRPTVTEVTDEMRTRLAARSAGFIISPHTLDGLLKPGERRPQAVEVRNLTREKITLKADVTEWQKTPDGQDTVADRDPEKPRSAAGWLGLRSEEVVLGPLARRRLPILITVPRDAQGEAYAAVSFSRPDKELDQSPRGRAQRSVLVRVRARGTLQTDAKIEQFTFKRQPSGSLLFITRMKNTGNAGFEPQVIITIKDGAGNEAGRIRMWEGLGLVQAGGLSNIEAAYDKILEPGEYTAEVALRFDPNKPPRVERLKLEIKNKLGAETRNGVKPPSEEKHAG